MITTRKRCKNCQEFFFSFPPQQKPFAKGYFIFKSMSFWRFFLSGDDNSGPPASESSVEDLAKEDAVKIVMATWAELMRKKEEVGLRIYQEVLLKEVEMSRLFVKTKIEKQSSAFMTMLDKVVGYLDDLSTLDEKLSALGATHLDQYGVKKRHFKHFRTAFMRAIKQYIPWTDRREAAWMWFWARVIDRMTADNSLIPFARDTTPQQFLQNARAIHETFDAVISDDPQRFSVTFYQNLLEGEPDIANLFKDIEINQQGAKFISMVRHCIHLLDDHRTFEYKMVELGKVHHTYGVQVTQLQSFGDVLTSTVRRNSPLKWTEQHTKAWQWFWKIVVDLFSRGILEQIEEKKELEEWQQEKKQQAEETKAITQNTSNDHDHDNTEEVNEHEELAVDLSKRYNAQTIKPENDDKA